MPVFFPGGERLDRDVNCPPSTMLLLPNMQRCTNLCRQVATATTFCTVATICVSLVRKFASCHASSAWNFEVAPRFVGNLCSLAYKHLWRGQGQGQLYIFI